MATLQLRKAAIKQYKKLPETEKIKIERKLREIASAPMSGKMLKGEYAGYYSFRAWPYRIIYRYTHDLGVEVFSIAHRQGVYK